MYTLKHLSYSLMLFLFVSCSEAEQEAEVEVTEAAPAQQGISYADSTKDRVQAMLQTYYSLKDALVAADSIKSVEAATSFAGALENLNLSSLQQSDPALYASISDLPLILKKNAGSITKKAELEAQREIFKTISDNLYDLIKHLKPAGIEIYQQYCPMAFNDKGAAWLSDTMHIQNPYFGKRMLTCGEVQEELRYR